MVATERLGRATGRVEASGQEFAVGRAATLQAVTRVKPEQAPKVKLWMPTRPLTQLNTEGRNELAEAFRQLTEAIAGSTDLDDAARKELLEHLSVVSEETAKPAEQRKLGPLKSSLTVIKTGIAVAAQLFGIYQGLEHALRAAGVIP